MPVPAQPAPSDEVSEHALAQAKRLAKGLYPHQVDGVAFLLSRRRAILADDMGLGKTRQSLVAIQSAEPGGPWLVVCPDSVKLNWAREIELAQPHFERETIPARNAPEVVVVKPKTQIPGPDFRGYVVLNYDILKKHLTALSKIPFAGFIFDEAHYLKNHQTQRSKATRKLIAAMSEPIVYCLTGTPMLNRPRDLFPLLQLANHPLGKSFLGFAKRYCDAKKGEYGWETKGASNLDELTVQLHGTMLRRTKDEVLDLPGKIRNWFTVDDPKASGSRGLKRILVSLFKGRATLRKQLGEDVESLPPISRAKLIARLTPIRTQTAGGKIRHTVEFAKGIVDQGEKVVIYTCFREVGETIVDEFDSAQVRFFTGASSMEQRQACIDDFQQDPKVQVLVATLIAGGVGITLTAARHVIFNDLDWVPANHWQAEDRLYRIGQQQCVHVYYFKAAKSLDEFVGHVLESKSHVIGQVVDGQAAIDQNVSDASPESNAQEAPEEGLESFEGYDALGQFASMLREMEAGSDFQPADAWQSLQTEIAGRTVPTSPKTVASDPLHQPKKATLGAIQALARALAPAEVPGARYQMASSSGETYELDVVGTDVVCSCRGFQFRGQCKHARSLKEALATDGTVPEEYRPI